MAPDKASGAVVRVLKTEFVGVMLPSVVWQATEYVFPAGTEKSFVTYSMKYPAEFAEADVILCENNVYPLASNNLKMAGVIVQPTVAKCIDTVVRKLYETIGIPESWTSVGIKLKLVWDSVTLQDDFVRFISKTDIIRISISFNVIIL